MARGPLLRRSGAGARRCRWRHAVAIDETAARRGHDYISLFVDIEQARVLFATEGRDASTVAAFAQDLTAHRGVPEAVSEVCIDMSPAFIKGVADNLPEAAITFDKFHAVKIINEAVDQLRDAPNGRRKPRCAAHATSGCAIPPTCRNARKPCSTACRPII